MPIVKLTTQHPRWPLSRQFPDGDPVWGDYQFDLGHAERTCDWWVVCEGLPAVQKASCPPGRRVLITWEPPSRIPSYAPQFLAQFDFVLTCHRELQHPGVHYGLQGHPWFVDRSYDQLKKAAAPGKRALVSIVTSNKAYLPGQRRRLEAATELKARLGDDAVILGRGFSEFTDKWDAIGPFPVTVAIENDLAEDWATEKLYDCFLAWTVPFYAGCPNIDRYFPDGAVERIDLDDLDDAADRIRAALADPRYLSRKLEVLSEARALVLDRYNLFPLIAGLLDELAPCASDSPRPVVLSPEFVRSSLARRTVGRLAWELRGRRQPPAGAKPRWWWEWGRDAR